MLVRATPVRYDLRVSKRLVMLAVLAATACSSGTRRVGSQPSWRVGSQSSSPGAQATSQRVAAITFAPTSEAATRYNDPLEALPPSPLGDAVLAAVREAAAEAKVPVPVADARLFRACAELAQVIPEDGIISFSVVDFALQRHGIIEPTPDLLTGWGPVDAPDELVEQLRPWLAEHLAHGAPARVGIGVGQRKPDGTGAIVFALLTTGVSTAPIPRSVPAGSSFVIDAVVDGRYRDPALFVTRPSGNTEQLALEHGKQGAFTATVSCGRHVGRQQVEITASDTGGSTVLANFPVWCGAEPPRSITIEPTHDDDTVVSAGDAEKRLFALVNRDRQAAGLPPLVWDDRVTAVSRAHSEDMRTAKFVAHISPTTGAAADRVRAAGIKTAVVLENVARAYGVGEAHAGLMNSPGHRANVLSTAATHVGIGVVLGDEVAGRREMLVTQVFIRIPPKVERSKAVEIVRQRISAVRPVVVNAGLASIAQEIADGLVAGKSSESLWPVARNKLDAMSTPYMRVSSVVSAVVEIESVDGRSLLGTYTPDDIGVGIAQGTHPEIGENAVWIVVLMAERASGRPAR